MSNSGSFQSVAQATGSITFDGLSSVTSNVTDDTNQAVGGSIGGTGTYSVQANCTGAITIGTASFTLAIFNGGRNFAISGSDATYSYAGSGNLPAPLSSTCSNSTLNGPFTFNATGFSLSGSSVNGVADVAGLLQFDGQGNLTANTSTATGGAVSTGPALSGTYTITSNCLGNATLTDSSANSFVMSFSIFTFTANNTNLFATLAQSGHFLVSGAAHGLASSAGTETCSASSLNGTYPFSLNGRAISGSGNFAGSYQGIGTATFDGNGKVTLTGIANSNLAQRTPFSYSGTYTLPSSCSGTVTASINGTATFTLVVWANGVAFAMVGGDNTYTYAGGGNLNSPAACATSTLSGEYTFNASGFTQSGTAQTGAQDEAGVLQLDGQGNITSATFTDSQSATTAVTTKATGTYTVGPGCSASATLKDSAGTTTNLNLMIGGPHGESPEVLLADSKYVRTGSLHSAFTNPSQAIANVASYAYSYTPPGSVFVIFGQDFAARPAGAVTTTLPTKLLNTTVTVNGDPVPLFYVDSGQIDAQMPWNVPGNAVASVVVTNGTSVSNAAAVYVPSAGTPGISTYGNNRAVVVNANGKVNSASDQAKVGDEVVVYFTGGGPVISPINLISGMPAGDGLSPLNGDSSITVGEAPAHIDYIGLTPGSIGLYQANFNVPQLARGAYPVQITVGGNPSNSPVMNVAN